MRFLECGYDPQRRTTEGSKLAKLVKICLDFRVFCPSGLAGPSQNAAEGLYAALCGTGLTSRYLAAGVSGVVYIASLGLLAAL